MCDLMPCGNKVPFFLNSLHCTAQQTHTSTSCYQMQSPEMNRGTIIIQIIQCPVPVLKAEVLQSEGDQEIQEIQFYG